jgi:hypothetical protein
VTAVSSLVLVSESPRSCRATDAIRPSPSLAEPASSTRQVLPSRPSSALVLPPRRSSACLLGSTFLEHVAHGEIPAAMLVGPANQLGSRDGESPAISAGPPSTSTRRVLWLIGSPLTQCAESLHLLATMSCASCLPTTHCSFSLDDRLARQLSSRFASLFSSSPAEPHRLRPVLSTSRLLLLRHSDLQQHLQPTCTYPSLLIQLLARWSPPPSSRRWSSPLTPHQHSLFPPTSSATPRSTAPSKLAPQQPKPTSSHAGSP